MRHSRFFFARTGFFIQYPGGIIVTMFQRKRIKAIQEEVERQHAAVEARADGLLEKLKGSKWTAAILLGAVVFAIMVLWSLS
jgi:hypothetical protein